MEPLNEPLSERERQIVRLGARGLTDKEIADRLAVSITTVRTYWIRLRRKLNASNRAQAIAHALTEGSRCRLKEAAMRLADQPWLGMAVIDENNRIVEANSAYRSMMGEGMESPFTGAANTVGGPRIVELPAGKRAARKVIVAILPLGRDSGHRAAYLIPLHFAVP
jgi:DNA-binding CsgD family transcriptional regulator